MALNMTPRLQNGNLGLFVDNSNSTEQSLDYFSHLWETGKLLNPVIGMRFNPENPKLTIGALDPADYEGEINWVQLETPNESWDLLNLFKIDGFKGYNGSFFPYGSSDTLAGLNSGMYLVVHKLYHPADHRPLQCSIILPFPTITPTSLTLTIEGLSRVRWVQSRNVWTLATNATKLHHM